MKFYLDSSVFVAAVTDIEPHHETCAALLLGDTTLCSRPHALAETFSSLTGGRLSLRLSPTSAARLIEVNLLPRLSLSDLSPAEVMRALRESEARGVRGGAIHDFLHLAAARKANATRLYSLNVRHFQAFHRPGDPEVIHP
jgi:predicted nucleic acid-binding protein